MADGTVLADPTVTTTFSDLGAGRRITAPAAEQIQVEDGTLLEALPAGEPLSTTRGRGR